MSRAGDTTTLSFVTLDVFTDVRFGGNPLAVVFDAAGLSGEVMQAVAREFNLSETVFVLPPDDPRHHARLRIFTPGRELPFAGHPTVGAALTLDREPELWRAWAHDGGRIPSAPGERRFVLEEGVGPVEVRLRGAGDAATASLTVPGTVLQGPPPPPAERLAAILGLRPEEISSEGFEPVCASAGVPFVLVPVRDLAALERVRVNAAAWEKELGGAWATELYLFVDGEQAPGVEAPGREAPGVETPGGEAPAGPVDGVPERRRRTLRARMFAPALGIAEDPATGAAAAALAGVLGARALAGGAGAGTLAWTIHQGVEMGRPSLIRIEVDLAPGAVAAVRVEGGGLEVSRGTLRV